MSRTSLGWWTAARAEDLEVRRDDGRMVARVDSVASDRSWLAIWASAPNLGSIIIDSPNIRLQLREEPPLLPMVAKREPAASDSELTATYVVHNGSIEMAIDGSDGPVLQLDQLQLKAVVRDSEIGRTLEIDPITVLDDQPLTPELFNRGLQLIAPILADTASVEGRGSLHIDRIKVPLDLPTDSDRQQQIHVGGSFRLDEVTATFKDGSVFQTAVDIARILKLPVGNRLQLVDGSVVHFEVKEGRVFHEGLVFLVPEISPLIEWRTGGSVGLDESLDITIELVLPTQNRPVLEQLLAGRLKFHVEGTVDDPRLRLPSGRGWMDAVTELLPDVRSLGEGAVDPVLDVVDEILRNQGPNGLDRLLDDLRNRRAQRRSNRQRRRMNNER